MKRYLSLLLVIVLLVVAVPTTAFANGTSSITITFEAFDASRDKAFREWAGSITDFYINRYVDGVYNDLLNESISVMVDYSSSNTYRSLGFGKYEYNEYSLNYDALILEDREKAEELLKYTYMEQLSESAQKQAAKLVLSGFDSRDTGKWLELDAETGTWTYSPQLEAVTKQEQNELIEAACDFAIKAVERTYSVWTATVSLKGGKTDDVVGYVYSAAKDFASEAVDHIFDYLDKEMKEQLYSSMRKDIEDNIVSADDAAITYLRKTFVESENYNLSGLNDITEQDIIFPIEVKKKVFKQAVDEVLTAYEQHKNNAGIIAQELYDKSSVLDKEELKKTDVSQKILQMITVDAMRSAMKTLLDVAKKNFYPKEESDESTAGEEKSDESTTDTPSLGWFGNTFYDALKQGVDVVCDSYIEQIENDTQTRSESLAVTFKENWQDVAVALLKNALSNITESQWKKLESSLDDSYRLEANAASYGRILVKVLEICKASLSGEPTDKLIWELGAEMVKVSDTDNSVINTLIFKYSEEKLGEYLKDARETIKNCAKIADPAAWLDLGFSLMQMCRTWNDTHKGNAAADFEAFKAYQLWEVGSHGIQRGVAGFPSYADAINPNKTTSDHLVQKVSQILQQLNSESTCTRELLQILSTKSDLKKAVVEHFEKKGMKEEELKQKLSTQYEYIRKLYDAWSEQQTSRFLDYFA